MVGKNEKKERERERQCVPFTIVFIEIGIKQPFSRGYRVTFFLPFRFSREKLILPYLSK